MITVFGGDGTAEDGREKLVRLDEVIEPVEPVRECLPSA